MELDALVGKPVNLMVRPGDQGDNALVFTLNRLPYRDPAGPPPWLTATPTSTATASLEDSPGRGHRGGRRRCPDHRARAASPPGRWPGRRPCCTSTAPTTYTVLLSPAAEVLYVDPS